MTSKYISALAFGPLIVLAGCVTVPEPEPIPEVVEAPVVVMPVRTCIPVNELERVVIPAEVKRGTSITSVEATPVFVTDPETGEVREVTAPPQEVRTPFEVIITPEQIYYVNGEGRIVDDICPDTVILQEDAPIPVN